MTSTEEDEEDEEDMTGIEDIIRLDAISNDPPFAGPIYNCTLYTSKSETMWILCRSIIPKNVGSRTTYSCHSRGYWGINELVTLLN